VSREQTISINDITYTSVKDACRALGLSVTSVYEYRRRNHSSTEVAIKAVYEKSQTPSEGYKAFGMEFENIEQASRNFGVKGDMVRSIMRGQDVTLEEAIKIAKEHVAFSNKCIAHGVNPYAARNFVRNYGVSKDEAIFSLSLAASSKGKK
jgi:hypothetical protein